MSGNDEIEIACIIERETDMEYLISDGDRSVWIQKSQVIDEDIDSKETGGTITIPEWLAFEKGLIWAECPESHRSSTRGSGRKPK